MKKNYLLLHMLFLGIVVQAQVTKTWVSNVLPAAPNNWNDAASWSPSGVPAANDRVVFSNTKVDTAFLQSNVTCGSISVQGTSNVILRSVDAIYTVSLGATIPALNVISSRVLSLSGSAASTGTILSIPTGGTATINGGLALAIFNNSLATQANQLLSVDAGSVVVGNGGSISNNSSNSGQPFGTYVNNNVIVFQSGSSYNVYSTGTPFGTASGLGTAQFLSGSSFNVFGGTGFGIANAVAGRTYGRFAVSNGTAGTAVTNNSSLTTTFLDSLVISGGNITLTGDGVNSPNPTFSIRNIRISSSSAAANSTSTLAFRTATAAAATNTTYVIGGTIDLIAGSATTSGSISLTLGPNGVGGTTSVSSTNISFTGANSAIRVTRQPGAGINPTIAIGVPTGLGTTGTLQTNITIDNGASLALGDSITLRSGANTYTSLTIRPTGRLTLTDSAVLTTQNNGYFTIESDATGSGTIGTVVGKLINSGTVQRFIRGNSAWRTLGFPFNSTTYTGGTPTPPTSVSLSYFVGPNPRAYFYNDTLDNGQYGTGGTINAGWVPITANTINLSARRGLLLYGSTVLGSTTLSLTGFLNFGRQAIALSKITNGNGWNLIANPYASNISFSSVATDAENTNNNVLLANTVYRVNPLGNGAYSFSSYSVSSNTGTNGGSDVIENGASFFVQAATEVSNLIINEKDKTNSAVGSTTGGISLLGANDNYNSVRLNLKGANTFSDEVVFVWGKFSKATEGFDAGLDAYDLGASGTHDLSIVGKDGIRYAVFNGSDLSKETATRTYKLATKALQLGTYEFNVSVPTELDLNSEAYIVDNYLHIATLVKDGLSHKFEVTTDLLSKSEDRFQLEIRKKLTSVALEVSNSNTYLLGNPTTNNQIAIRFGSAAAATNWQLVDISGRVVSNGVFKNVNQGDTRVAEVKALKAGTYIVKLLSDNEATVVMKWVKL